MLQEFEKRLIVNEFAVMLPRMAHFGQWLKARREKLKRGNTRFTAQMLADAIGSSPETVRKWEASEKLPQIGRSRIHALAIALRLTVNDLIAIGAGEKDDAPLGPEPSSSASGFRKGPPESMQVGRGLVAVPIVNSVRAGAGAAYTNKEYEAGVADSFIPLPAECAADPDAFVLKVEGDSMSPLLEEGTFVVCCPHQPFEPGAVYAVQKTGIAGDGNTLKIVMDGGEDWELLPANPLHPRDRISKELASISRAMYQVKSIPRLRGAK